MNKDDLDLYLVKQVRAEMLARNDDTAAKLRAADAAMIAKAPLAIQEAIRFADIVRGLPTNDALVRQCEIVAARWDALAEELFERE